MILVTVGTQKFQFNRLFKELDDLVDKGIISEKIVAQIGYTDYVPKYFDSSKLIAAEEMEELFSKCSLVITHSGTSSIIKSLKYDKKVIVVPRLAKFDEHVDDHQLEIAELFAYKNLVEPVYDIKDLGAKIELVKEKNFTKYNFNNSNLLNSIDEYLLSLLKKKRG